MDIGEKPQRPPVASMDYIGCDEPSFVLTVAWMVLFALLVVVLCGLIGMAALRMGIG